MYKNLHRPSCWISRFLYKTRKRQSRRKIISFCRLQIRLVSLKYMINSNFFLLTPKLRQAFRQ